MHGASAKMFNGVERSDRNEGEPLQQEQNCPLHARECLSGLERSDSNLAQLNRREARVAPSGAPQEQKGM